MSRTTLLTRAAALAAIAGAGFFAVAPTASAAVAAPTGSSDVTLAPAHSLPGVPESRAYFIRTVAAGSSFTDSVLVHNSGSKPARLTAASVDGITAQLTGAVYSSGRAVRDGRWVTLATTAVTVPAQQTVAVPFTVHVPVGAAIGQHLAGIAVVGDSPAVATRGALSIRTVYRNVMGILVTVPGPARSSAAFTGVSTAPGTFSGLATVNVTFRNTGALLIRPTLTVLLTRGHYRQQVVRHLNTVLPRDTVDYPLSWPTPLGAGSYDVTASLAAGGMTTAVYRSALAAHQPMAGGASAPLRPFLASTPRAAGLPVAAVLGAVAAALLVGAVGTCWILVVRRRRRPAVDITAAAEQTERPLVSAR